MNRRIWLLFALLSWSCTAYAASDRPPEKIGTLYFSLSSWKGMTVHLNVRGTDVLYRCSLYDDEALTRWTSFSVSAADSRYLFTSLEELRVFEWDEKYIAPVADGEWWSIEADFNGKHLRSTGSNAEPKQLPALVDRVSRLLGKFPFGFSGKVEYSTQAHDCSIMKVPLRNSLGNAPR